MVELFWHVFHGRGRLRPYAPWCHWLRGASWNTTVGLLVYWERAAYCNSEPKKDDWLSINVLEMSKEMQRFDSNTGYGTDQCESQPHRSTCGCLGTFKPTIVPKNFRSDFSDHRSVGYCTLKLNAIVFFMVRMGSLQIVRLELVGGEDSDFWQHWGKPSFGQHSGLVG